MDIDTYRNKWWIMVAVSLALFMGAVDGTIVNVALPTLAAEFNASFATVQWVVLAFLLGLSILLLSGAFFASRLVYYAGQPMDISDAPASTMVNALHDQFLVVAGLIAIGLLLALLAWRSERRS